MGRGRLEAFSDGVLAVIITIMVLELKVPHGADLAALGPLIPVFLSYVLSFIFVGIYWSNHHHLLHAGPARQRPHPVGQPASTVLAVPNSFRHRLDGREPLRRLARCLLWRGVTMCCDSLLHPGPRPHFIPRQGFCFGEGAG